MSAPPTAKKTPPTTAAKVPATAAKKSVPNQTPKTAPAAEQITPDQNGDGTATQNGNDTEISTTVTRTGIADNPAIITTELFGQNRVMVLRSDDFKLDSEHQIDLKNKDCILILFHTNNEESKNMAIIWNSVAQQVPGPIFAAVNLLIEPKLAKAFTNLNTTNSTYRSFELKGVPFVITYQNGTPVGFYNGERAVQPIADYALTLACKSDYFEPLQLTAGVQADANISMTGWTEYDETKKSSVDFTTDKSIRNYDPTKKPTIVGSSAFSEEGQQVAQTEEQAGITETTSGQQLTGEPEVTAEEQQSATTAGVTPATTTTTTETPVSPQ